MLISRLQLLPSNITTSDGTFHRITVKTSKIPPPFALANWTLTAEHWDPPANLSDIETIAVIHNTTHSLPGTQVPPWPKIKGLQKTSGVGYYTTAFAWPPPRASIGLTNLSASVQFTSLALQSLRLAINNVTYPKPLDYFNPSAEGTPYLRHVSNSLTVTIATTMFKGLQPIWNQLKTANASNILPATAVGVDSGLVGEVVIVPFVEYVV